jgi:hypothetical protein
MKNDLPKKARRAIDRTMVPVIKEFQLAVASMRSTGASDRDVEDALDLAIESSIAAQNPAAAAYMLGKLRKAVGLPFFDGRSPRTLRDV